MSPCCVTLGQLPPLSGLSVLPAVEGLDEAGRLESRLPLFMCVSIMDTTGWVTYNELVLVSHNSGVRKVHDQGASSLWWGPGCCPSRGGKQKGKRRRSSRSSPLSGSGTSRALVA